MATPATKHVCLAAILMSLAGIGSFPVLAEAPEGVILETGKPVVTELIRRILEDPHRGYPSVDSSFDCNSETLYLGTRDLLGKYVDNPVEYQAALRDYILSGKEQCHCTQAIIGKDFDILLDDLGSETSRFRSCDDMHGDPPSRSK